MALLKTDMIQLARVSFIIIFLSGLVTGPLMAFAEEQVALRFAQHDGFERVVFEWASAAPSYQLERKNYLVTLNFENEASYEVKDISGADSALIKTLDIRSPKTLDILINQVTDIRDVKIGSKIIVDFYGDLTQSHTVKTPVQQTAAIRPAAGEGHFESKGRAEESISELATHEEKTAETHIFSISLTENSLAAAFQYMGYMWFVLDRANIPLDPYIEGPTPEIFGKLEELSINHGSATAWRFKMPPGYKAHGEGGNIVWRLILTKNDLNANRQPLAGKAVLKDDHGKKTEAFQFSLPLQKKKFDIIDPLTGQKITVVAVENSTPFIQDKQKFVTFDLLPSIVGMAYISKVDDLEVELTENEITLVRAKGLKLSHPENISRFVEKAEIKKTAVSQDPRKIFNFGDWQMGPMEVLDENQNIILSSLSDKMPSAKAERLMTLAKLNLSHGMGAEAQGYLDYAGSVLPELRESAVYQAIYGVAAEVTGQHLEALSRLSRPSLAQYTEINFWKAAALAHLGDWKQAAEILPSSEDVLLEYPPVLKNELTLTLAEIALRNGNVDAGEGLLKNLHKGHAELTKEEANELKYLQGEVHRQKGQPENAIKLWTELSKSPDDLFRAKSELALISLGQSAGSLPLKDAIERLDQLRFVWRGDDLELQVLKKLGTSQIENKDYLRGLSTLRDTVVLSQNNNMNNDITNQMMGIYKNLFTTDQLQTIPATDAAMLYEQFRELTPPGKEGDDLVARLADHLADEEFFDRAISLLEYQLQYRLKGEEAIKTATRLASLYLLNSHPEDALKKLNKAETILKKSGLANSDLLQRDIDLLRARALADNKDVNAALNLLGELAPATPDVSRLEADIAWRNGRWYEAAEALHELVLHEDFKDEADLTDDQAQMLMNYAITLNLSSGRVALANLRERFLPKMEKTENGKLFEVVTRPRQDGMLADRETMEKMIAETEIFGDFLKSYRAVN